MCLLMTATHCPHTVACLNGPRVITSVGRGSALTLTLALLQAEQHTDGGSAMRATSVLHALTVSSGLALAKMRVFAFELPGLCGREERAQAAGEMCVCWSPRCQMLGRHSSLLAGTLWCRVLRSHALAQASSAISACLSYSAI
jgi:hypothetical protein